MTEYIGSHNPLLSFTIPHLVTTKLTFKQPFKLFKQPRIDETFQTSTEILPPLPKRNPRKVFVQNSRI